MLDRYDVMAAVAVLGAFSIGFSDGYAFGVYAYPGPCPPWFLGLVFGIWSVMALTRPYLLTKSTIRALIGPFPY